MTSRLRLMGWNRVLETDRDDGRWFTFPKRILRSVRFGVHDCVMEPTMQILPVQPGTSPAAPQMPRPADGRARLSTAGSGCWLNAGSWLSV